MENLKEHYLNLADNHRMDALSFAQLANKDWSKTDRSNDVLKYARLSEMNCRLAELYYKKAEACK